MVLYNFKTYEKDTCNMPHPSPSGSLKKQSDSAVIEEARLTYNERRREAKLHLIKKLSLHSMQQKICGKFFLCCFCI